MKLVCTRCVMDTSDPNIQFSENGICNHCRAYDHLVAISVMTGERAKARLDKLVSEIRDAGRRKPYDCIIGVSGGVDSTYVAYRTKILGLRPLAVHLDNGWDSELAVKNVERVLKKLEIDLYTHVMNWDEFRDLQLAFLRASTPDCEIPTDHAIVSLLFQLAIKFRVKYILSGCNFRTESHLPEAWSRGHSDWVYIRSVHRRFGRIKLQNYPHRSVLMDLIYRRMIRWIDILDYVDYVKKDALEILQGELAWEYYGGKHYESIYTRFYQGYILPHKFGYDKRRMHLSSLICSGELNRESALKELQSDPYPRDLMASDREYVIKKLGLTASEFEEIMQLSPRTIRDYHSTDRTLLYRSLRFLYRLPRAFRPAPR